MTMRTSQRSPNDLAYEAARAYPGGVEALAFVMGKNPKLLYKKLSPAHPDYQLTIDEFSELMERCEGAGVKNALAPLEALNWRHSRLATPIDSLLDTSDEDLRKSVLESMAELGALASRIEEALAEGELTDNHMEKLEPAKRGLFTKLGKLWQAIKARRNRDASKPRTSFFAKVKKTNSHDFETAAH